MNEFCDRMIVREKDLFPGAGGLINFISTFTVFRDFHADYNEEKSSIL